MFGKGDVLERDEHWKAYMDLCESKGTQMTLEQLKEHIPELVKPLSSMK